MTTLPANNKTFSYFSSVSWEENGGRRDQEFIQGNSFLWFFLRVIVRTIVLYVRDWRNR